MGIHVKKTVTRRKDLRPHTSDRAPIKGALRKDKRPWKKKDNNLLVLRRKEQYFFKQEKQGYLSNMHRC